MGTRFCLKGNFSQFTLNSGQSGGEGGVHESVTAVHLETTEDSGVNLLKKNYYNIIKKERITWNFKVKLTPLLACCKDSRTFSLSSLLSSSALMMVIFSSLFKIL